ncbi:MAG: hypothetical protein UV63_C0001G0031 [Microgenomates group bacterium GW2011_GWC1_43_11]|uniref:Glycosyltransferase RgtA/B/C/D-like domain-containing protein n=2 Tax=Candidatus Gottesmaniibacteriota TaxID=1752720 RepID=A0A0G1IRP9_9BACT|nr:MAG: hypothetical protein UV63_C0001G0031 [Microgenomates group bacterium GW2011_GWC1_43_11]KKT39120.1 MAG: hypothetical protein UW22_C0001G0031 [Candidatus Gottesmanbacteria bacterium GW2011_GWB1_44_11c]KKT61593.1 MAG: hypothetical protein UW52_C0001G0031 [Candidatus Gottesmanbacteria bacterium GW2011_GWA1_44_24b]
MRKKYFWLIFIIVLALLLRIVILSHIIDIREHTDILRYKDWARIAFLYGFADTYKSAHLQFGTLPNNQPPGLLYILSCMYFIGIQISKIVLAVMHVPAGSLPWLNVTLITLLFRVPPILSDLIIGSAIYFILKKITPNVLQPYIGMGLFLFNPVIIYNSTVWGQMDAVVNCFFIASLYFLLNKKIFPSILLFLLSIYTKLSLLYNLPFMLLLWWKNMPKGKYITYLIPAICFVFIFTLPVNNNPLIWISLFIKNNAIGEMTNITAYALNVWWMIFRPHAIPEGIEDSFHFSVMHLVGSPSDTSAFYGIPLFWYGILIFFIFLIPIALNLLQKKISTIFLIRNLFIISLLAFLVLPRMHERYMYPIFPLLTILAVCLPWYMAGLFALSILHFINMYIVYHPFLLAGFPYAVWGQKHVQWLISIFIVLIAVVFYVSTVFPNMTFPKKEKRNI